MLRATPPTRTLTATVKSMADWVAQERQYPPSGPPGLSYFPGETPAGVIDCLLWRNEAGELVGILNHYPFRTPEGQEPGSINFWVKPGWQRRGIGTRLMEEADRRWVLAFDRQVYTPEGLQAAVRLMRKHEVPTPGSSA